MNRAETLALPQSRRRSFGIAGNRTVEALLALGAFLLVAVLLQYRAGAFQAEFGQDDSSHYISGLLIHDYLLHGLPHSPLAFLRSFHAHYPLVGIGHWPPFYYGVEAVWELLFSVSRTSVMLLSATVTAATAMVLYFHLSHRLGRIEGALAGLFFICSPLVQSSTSLLMLDVPVALLCLLAALCYLRYLDTLRLRWGMGFAVFAVAAAMTKGTALCLALFPALAVLIGRRFDLLRRPSFWLPAPIVAVLVAPWYAATYGLTEAGFRYSWGLVYTRLAIATNAGYVLDAVGPVVLALGLLGFVLSVLRRRVANDLVVAAALAASVYAFQDIVPAAFQDRYLVPLLPPLLILAAHGARSLCAWLAAWVQARRGKSLGAGAVAAAVAVVALISYLPYATAITIKPTLGISEAASQIWRLRSDTNPAVLIAADADGESAAITELAMRDPQRPSLFAVRGSRLLGGGGYNNSDYVPRFANAREVMAAIDDYAIPYVLLRASGRPGEWGHLQQLNEARALYPDRWQLVYRDEVDNPNVLLFRIRGNPERSADTNRLIDLSAPNALKR